MNISSLVIQGFVPQETRNQYLCEQVAAVTEKVYPAEKDAPVKKDRSVLFVCTANICRSPMAAALMRARLQKEQSDWREWRVESAGTWAMEGEMAARFSRQVMAERGLDISAHRARTVTAEMLHKFDLILTMEPGQKEALQVEFPAIAKRVFLLSEMDGTLSTVEDPYGRAVEAYKQTAEKIDRMLANGMARIVALAAGNRLNL
jgi:protein-tyrosine phosphatase